MSGKKPLPDELAVLLDGRIAGTLRRATERTAAVFTYESSWRDEPSAYPLSLSMPLAGRQYKGFRVDYYLRALLSDNEARLNAIAHEFGVSPDDHFALLSHIGEDCPGAVQFARPERVRTLTGDGPGKVAWLKEAQVAEILRELSDSSVHGASIAMTGQFSLPGALSKVALVRNDRTKRWGRPSGRAASTHIIKPPLGGVRYHNENEHLCLELATRCGLGAAKSFLLRAEEMQAIAVERYDRSRSARIVNRLHQEDMSQALGVNPRLKYSAEGAPGIADVVLILREQSSRGLDDVYDFLRAVAFNWLIAATDAHPRNYSILISSGAQVRLAPLYDLASALMLPTRMQPDELPFAMTVGGRKKLGAITRAAWETEARKLRLDSRRLIGEIGELAHNVAAAVDLVADVSLQHGVDERFAASFATRLRRRAKECLRELTRQSPS